MPPKTRVQRKAESSTAATLDPCCICLQKIGPKDEALFCSGKCQKYLHRYCASVSESSYKTLTSEGALPFLCFCCYKAQKDDQLSRLLSEIEKLRAEISTLKTGAAVLPPSVPSYAEAAKTQRNPAATAAITASGESHTKPMSGQYYQDSKFNAVLYGVQECPLGMSKSARFESDLTATVNVLSPLDSSIQPQSIKDCFRLGKFSSNAPRPRPILIKFVRKADVTSILSKRKNLFHPYSIKPDMSPDQRLNESILLKERWSLIQSGVSRSHIRIRGNSIYVLGKLHGRVLNHKFVRDTQKPSNPKSRSNSPIVQQGQLSNHNVQVTPAFDELNVSSVDNLCSQSMSSVSGGTPIVSSVLPPES